MLTPSTAGTCKIFCRWGKSICRNGEPCIVLDIYLLSPQLVSDCASFFLMHSYLQGQVSLCQIEKISNFDYETKIRIRINFRNKGWKGTIWSWKISISLTSITSSHLWYTAPSSHGSVQAPSSQRKPLVWTQAAEKEQGVKHCFKNGSGLQSSLIWALRNYKQTLPLELSWTLL